MKRTIAIGGGAPVVKWGFRHLALAPDDGNGSGAGGTPPAPAPAPAPAAGAAPAPAAAPKADHTALVAGIQQRRAAREAARAKPAAGSAQLPKDIADKVARLDAYEATEKAKQDAEVKKLTPEAKAVFDAIPDLNGRRAFLAFHASKTPPPPANPPPASGNGGGPPAQGSVDVVALAAEKGIDFVKKHHPEAYEKYAAGFEVGGKSTSLSSAFTKKKK